MFQTLHHRCYQPHARQSSGYCSRTGGYQTRLEHGTVKTGPEELEPVEPGMSQEQPADVVDKHTEELDDDNHILHIRILDHCSLYMDSRLRNSLTELQTPKIY